MYFAGDGAKKDDDGDLWLLGRVDDVMNVSGHRISTTEVESALVSHPSVAEAAVVGATDPTTGQAIVAFVIVRGHVADDEAHGEQLVAELRDHVAHEIGPIAKPRQIMLVAELPKTRSGKIMRRLLRDVAEHRDAGRRHDAGRPDGDEPHRLPAHRRRRRVIPTPGRHAHPAARGRVAAWRWFQQGPGEGCGPERNYASRRRPRRPATTAARTPAIARPASTSQTQWSQSQGPPVRGSYQGWFGGPASRT